MPVAAAIEIHAVAVGVDGQPVDLEIVYSGGEQAEGPALENGKILQQDVSAVFEGDCFIADPGASARGVSCPAPRLNPRP